MLGMGRFGGFKALESFGDIAGHGELDSTLGIIPFEGDTAIKLAFLVGCHLVFGGNNAGRLSACSHPTYWMPKSSTTNKKG